MPIEPRAQPSLQTTVAVERDHIVSHGQCFLRVYKAGRFGGHLERPNLLIPPVPILRSLKGAAASRNAGRTRGSLRRHRQHQPQARARNAGTRELR